MNLLVIPLSINTNVLYSALYLQCQIVMVLEMGLYCEYSFLRVRYRVKLENYAFTLLANSLY